MNESIKGFNKIVPDYISVRSTKLNFIVVILIDQIIAYLHLFRL